MIETAEDGIQWLNPADRKLKNRVAYNSGNFLNS
jgi:hypothetical protein